MRVGGPAQARLLPDDRTATADHEMSRTFLRPKAQPPAPSPPDASGRAPTTGPGGGTSAPPELVESDRQADRDELSDGGAGSARHTGDESRPDA